MILYLFGGMVCCRDCFRVLLRPLDQPMKNRKQCAALVSEPVFDTGWNLGVEGSVDQTEGLQFVQRRGEHPFGDIPWNGAPEVAEA